jgi:hypothetical protein
LVPVFCRNRIWCPSFHNSYYTRSEN